MPTETTTPAPQSKTASAPAAANGTALPVEPAAKPTTLDVWLAQNGAEKIGETKGPTRLKSTASTLACYAVDNHEIWVLSWANGQRWTILTDVDGIAGLEDYLSDGREG